MVVVIKDWDQERLGADTGRLGSLTFGGQGAGAGADDRATSGNHSQSPGEPNLGQLLVNLQPGKRFYQVIIDSSHKRSVELAHILARPPSA